MRFYFLTIIILLIFMSGLAGQDSRDVTLDISQFSGLPSDETINKVIVDDNGLLWAATSSGLYLINPSLGTAELQSEFPDVKDVVFTVDGLWMAYKNIIADLNTKEEIVLEKATSINDIALVDNSIWAATDAGLYKVIVSTKRITHLTTKISGLKSNYINFIHQDRHKITWLGTDKGYVRIDDGKWETEDDKYKMFLTYENSEGQWIISEDDLFLINQYNRYFPVGIEEGLIQRKVKDFTIDSKGKIYIVSDIIVRYDPYENKIEDFIENVEEITSTCTSVERDRNDNIWIGTENNGLFVIRFSDNTSDALFANLTITNEVRCQGENSGALEVIVVGGIPPYTFEWDDGKYEGATRTNLTAGSYSVIVKDNSGQSFKSHKVIPEPEELKINHSEIINPKSADIQNGSIAIQAQGGTGNLSYSWSNGMSGSYLSGLNAGEYNLTVADSRGCTLTGSFQINKPKYIPELTEGRITLGTTLRIEQLYFEADSTNLGEENFPVIDEIYDFLLNNPAIKIEIGGHTNTIPPHEYCDMLSTNRAKTVATYLYDKGIKTDRITYVGYGKRKPLTEERNSSARRKNQRVELKIIEI